MLAAHGRKSPAFLDAPFVRAHRSGDGILNDIDVRPTADFIIGTRDGKVLLGVHVTGAGEEVQEVIPLSPDAARQLAHALLERADLTASAEPTMVLNERTVP